MNRSDAMPYVRIVGDDGNYAVRIAWGAQAFVREAGFGFRFSTVLVGWQCGSEPVFVAVHRHLDVEFSDEEAEELARNYARDYLGEFDCDRPADLIIR